MEHKRKNSGPIFAIMISVVLAGNRAERNIQLERSHRKCSQLAA
jgi:hypothetical protein